MKKVILVMFFFSLLLAGCSASSTTKEESYSAKNIPPGQCRLVASVVKIDTVLSSINEKDPCSKAPCNAWILVKKIIGYGAGSVGINVGDTLRTKFAFTLDSTNQKTFPSLKENLPGLKEGSVFEADVQLIPSNPTDKNKLKVYLVYGYKIIE